MKEFVPKLVNGIKGNIVLTIAWVLAIISTLLVRPTVGEAFNSIHWNTIMMILSLMVVMAGLKRLGVLTYLGQKLLNRAKTQRSLELVLVMATFFSAMLVTNDVSLLTFVPFAIETIRMANLKERLAPVVAMQAIAANLGSMLTPIGNPHNIFFFNLSGYSVLEFLKVTAPYSAFGGILLLIFVFIQKNKVIECELEELDFKADRDVILYLLLFVIALIPLTKIISSIYIGILVVTLVIIFDRKTLLEIDYSLLFTFIGFFIFVGNMQNVEILKEIIPQILDGREIFVSTVMCQFMNNVPVSILLGGFSTNYGPLILGTDIGGMGTLIASMANLIAYKALVKYDLNERTKFFKWFTFSSIGFLVLELALYTVLNYL